MPQRAKRTAAARSAGAESGRRAEVLALAADLFSRNGYSATTVRDIADAAGILSGSLYHHFPSKEAIVDAILRAFVEEVLAAYDEIAAADLPPRAAVEALANASLAALEHHQAAIVIYQNDGDRLAALERFAYLREAGERFERTWVSVLERGIERGDFRGGVDPALAYRVVRATLWEAARWHRPGGEPRPEQISGQYLSILLDGIAKSKAKKKKGKGKR